MDLTFRTAALAALCSSEHRLAARWGPEAGRTVGRRLYELMSADPQNLERLPRTSVSWDGDGTMTIEFGGQVIVNGRLGTDGQRGDYIMITSVEVQGTTEG